MEEARCELCGGTGWQVVVEGNLSKARRCDCSRTVASQKMISSARIPPRYLACDFDNYVVVDKHFHSLGQPKRLLMDYVGDFPLLDEEVFREKSILLTGGAGLGKTHLAVAILKGLLRKGIACLFVDFHELLSEIRDSYDPLSGTSELQILRPVIQTEVLLLDDFGSRRMSEWMQDTVFHIVNLRYNQKKTLIATTNLRMEPSADSAGETLQDRVGYPVVSRLYEMCKIIQLEGQDYRKP